MVCLICNYLESVRYFLFVLRKYILKVHVLVSSEHKLCQYIFNVAADCVLTPPYCNTGICNENICLMLQRIVSYLYTTTLL